jgi:tetratricopeptide (TPR) repeat protein
MRRRLIAPLLVFAALAGCAGIDYEAQGDHRYSQGDYYGAVDSYKRVPPGAGTPELPSKLRTAENDFIEDSVLRSQRALGDGRFEEALTIARKALDVRRDERLLQVERDAKQQTVSNAVEVGKLHLQRGEFDEAIAQFETALRYDSSAATQALLLDAKTGAARKLAAEARRFMAANDFDAAISAMNRAILMHDAPEHQSLKADIEAAKERWLTDQFNRAAAQGRAAVAKKEYTAAAAHFRGALRYRASAEVEGRVAYCDAMAAGVAALAARDLAEADRRFREAIATNFDGGAAQAEIQKIDAHRNDLIRTAVEQRGNGEFAAAAATLQSAVIIRPDAGLDAWIRYCNHMQAGGEAVKRNDFAGAKVSFESAIAEGLDDQGLAQRYRDGVRVSTYTITLKSLTVKPFKANDEVWDGSLRRALPLGRILAGFAGKGGPAAAKKAADIAAALLPPANLPDLFVRITTPDGGVYRTDLNKEALHANIGAAFSVTGHAFSDDPVVIAVRDQDDKAEEGVGVWRTTVGKLISGNAAASAQFEQVFDLHYAVELKSEAPSPAWTSGCTVEKAPVVADPPAGTGEGENGGSGTNEGEGDGTTETPPAPAPTVWKITITECYISPTDIKTKRRDPIADPEVTLHSGNELLFTAYAGDDRALKRWRKERAPSTTITLAHDGKLTLKLSDRDAGGPDVVLTYVLDNAGLAQGAIRLETDQRSYVELTAVKQP